MQDVAAVAAASLSFNFICWCRPYPVPQPILRRDFCFCCKETNWLAFFIASRPLYFSFSQWKVAAASPISLIYRRVSKCRIAFFLFLFLWRCYSTAFFRYRDLPSPYNPPQPLTPASSLICIWQSCGCMAFKFVPPLPFLLYSTFSLLLIFSSLHTVGTPTPIN